MWNIRVIKIERDKVTRQKIAIVGTYVHTISNRTLSVRYLPSSSYPLEILVEELEANMGDVVAVRINKQQTNVSFSMIQGFAGYSIVGRSNSRSYNFITLDATLSLGTRNFLVDFRNLLIGRTTAINALPSL